MSAHPDADSVCAIMVTYEGGPLIGTTARVTAAQVEHLFIFDNGSGRETQAELASLEAGLGPRVTVHRNPRNVGIAAALNAGIDHALRGGYRWVLTLDQDSRCGPEMVAHLKRAWAEAASPSLAVLTPVSLAADEAALMAAPLPARDGARQPLRPLTWTHTSGNLVRADIFSVIGMFREEFFIDYVDYEFCHRLRRAGYTLAEVPDAHLFHRLGNKSQARVLGRSITYTNYSPLRRYYQLRNGLILVREVADPAFSRAWLDSMGREVAKVVLFECQKGKKLVMVYRGVRDALAGRLGPFTRPAARSPEPPEQD